MQDRPTAAELLEALAEMLFTEVRDWVPRERRFQVLVAANLCAVVARELRAGREPTRADVELFERLAAGYTAPDADPPEAARAAAARLAREIREGRLDDQLPAVMDGLREHVRRKLEVARPGYAD
jgi:hypothetical protein